MNKRLEAKLAMLRLVLAVLGKYGAVYAAASGLVAAVEALQEAFDAITGQNRAAEENRNSGGAAAREQATKELGDLAYSVAASVLSYASTKDDRALVDRMSYSRWEITRGRASSIIARCQGILNAATPLVDELADFLVTPADVKSLEKKITAFEEAYIKPRQGVVAGAAARKELPGLFGQATQILEERIVGMVFKFKEKSPEFFNEFTAARVIAHLPTASGAADNVVPNPNVTAPTTGAASGTPAATSGTARAA